MGSVQQLSSIGIDIWIHLILVEHCLRAAVDGLDHNEVIFNDRKAQTIEM